MTKVKGHARQEHIDKGLTTAAHATGNNKSDVHANMGHEHRGMDAANLSNWLQTRHDHLSTLMKGIEGVIIAMFHENKRMLSAKLLIERPFAKRAPP